MILILVQCLLKWDERERRKEKEYEKDLKREKERREDMVDMMHPCAKLGF